MIQRINYIIIAFLILYTSTLVVDPNISEKTPIVENAL
jgi:hypothetical protein